MTWWRRCTLTTLPDGIRIANQSTVHPACNSQSKRGSQISGEKSPNPAFLLRSLRPAPNSRWRVHRSGSGSISTCAVLVYWTGVPTGVRDKVEWDDALSNADKCRWKHALTAICFSADFKNFPVFYPQGSWCEKSCRFLRHGDVYLLPPALNCLPAVLGAVILHQHSADYFHLVSLVRKWFWHALTPCLLGINMRAMEKLQTVNK